MKLLDLVNAYGDTPILAILYKMNSVVSKKDEFDALKDFALHLINKYPYRIKIEDHNNSGNTALHRAIWYANKQKREKKDRKFLKPI